MFASLHPPLSDGNSDEDKNAVVRKEKKTGSANPMIQRVTSHDWLQTNQSLYETFFYSVKSFFSSPQTKKVEREELSSAESDEEKERKKVTVAYKSTRSAVSYFEKDLYPLIYSLINLLTMFCIYTLPTPLLLSPV